MPAFTKRSALFVAIELREARTTTGLYQGQTGKLLPINPEIDFDVAHYERVFNRSSMTGLASLAGMRTGRARFGLELTGGAGPTQFAEVIRCCAFADDILERFTIGAVTGGPFRHGERVNQASSGAYGLAVSDTWDTETVLWVTQQYQSGAGAFDAAGALVGASSGASATPSALVASGGRGWWPYSYRTSRMLFNATGLLSAVAEGQMLRGVTSRAVASVFIAHPGGANAEVMVQRQIGHFIGAEVVENLTTGSTNIGTTAVNGFEIALRGPTASIGLIKDYVREEMEWARGNVKLAGKIGEPAILDFEFLGKERGAHDQGASFSVDTGGIAVPPVLLGADFSIGHADWTPAQMIHKCIRSFSIDMRHELVIRECMATHNEILGPSNYGVAMAMVVSRQPTITIEQDLGPEAAFPWMDALLNNTPLRMKLVIGSVAGNRFTLTIPSMSASQAQTGDINDISQRNITLDLDGGNAPGPRADNELVLVQDFS